MKTPNEKRIEIIQTAYRQLKADKGYSQSKVVEKLIYLGHQTNKTTFNHILKNNQIGIEALIVVHRGVIELMKRELCCELNEHSEWIKAENCLEESIPISNDHSGLGEGLTLYAEGRLAISEKVKFIAATKSSITEFGITLSTFSNYLISRKESEFKNPLIQLLKKGVVLNCYVMDPDWNGTSLYFNDRSEVTDEGISGIEKIRSSLRRMKIFSNELQAIGLGANFKVFMYRHLPNNYFLLLDSNDSSNAKMMVSNYLFGEYRAYCPIVAFTRKDQPLLYRRYIDSFERIVKGSKAVAFSKVNV